MSDTLHLVYVSVANQPFSTAAMDDLLAIARRNNKAVGVTGLLVVRGQMFLQLLEGRSVDTKHIFKKITADPRHTSIEVLVETTSDRHLFPSWNMGMVDEAQLSTKLPELAPLLKAVHGDEQHRRNAILRILQEFSRAQAAA